MFSRSLTETAYSSVSVGHCGRSGGLTAANVERILLRDAATSVR